MVDLKWATTVLVVAVSVILGYTGHIYMQNLNSMTKFKNFDGAFNTVKSSCTKQEMI
jgi:hypothetical protein